MWITSHEEYAVLKAEVHPALTSRLPAMDFTRSHVVVLHAAAASSCGFGLPQHKVALVNGVPHADFTIVDVTGNCETNVCAAAAYFVC